MSGRGFSSCVVTATDLRGGHVVWRDAAGGWSADLAQAELLASAAEAEARLQLALGQTAVVIGVYLAEMQAGPLGPEPVHFREAFRARGPSIRPTKARAEAQPLPRAPS